MDDADRTSRGTRRSGTGCSAVGNLKIVARDQRSVTPQGEDFSAWYNDVVFRAELVDRGRSAAAW